MRDRQTDRQRQRVTETETGGGQEGERNSVRVEDRKKKKIERGGRG